MRFKWWQIAIGLILASFAVGAFAFIRRSSFSSDNIIVVIDGPEHVESGEGAVFQVGVDNKTSINLREVSLTLDLPSSLTTADSKRFTIFKWDRVSGGERTVENLALSAAVSGDQKEQVIRGRLEYSPEGFSGRFVSKAAFSLNFTPPPLTTIIDIPQSAVPGQEIEGTVHIVSQEEMSFSPLVISLNVPKGFIVSESSPVLDDNSFWRLEGVTKGQDYVFRFRGILQGVPGDQKDFLVAVGKETNGKFTALTQHQESLTMSDSPLSIVQDVAGTTGDAIYPGSTLNITLSYENLSSVAISDVTITEFLSGSFLNIATLQEGSGLFDGRTKTITWDKTRVPELREIAARAKGSVRFSVDLYPSITPQNAKDTKLTVESVARIRSPQRSLAFGGAAFEDQDSLELKVASNLKLTTKVFYGNGAFQNSGPVPPRVGETTTYTVLLQITNSTNDIGLTRVEGILPSYVRWLSAFSPASEALSYSATTHTFLWDLGNVPAGAGFLTPKKEVQFQVGLTPIAEDREKSVNIVEEVKASATDLFTGSFLEDTTAAVDAATVQLTD